MSRETHLSLESGADWSEMSTYLLLHIYSHPFIALPGNNASLQIINTFDKRLAWYC